MTTPTPLVRALAAIALAFALFGCQPGAASHPVPTVSQIGSDLKCASGDRGLEDLEAGWGFCIPGTWVYIEKSQGSTSPPGLDLTFDVTDAPCASAPPSANRSSAPVCSPNAGLFAFMIISTYERGTQPTLADWVQANFGTGTQAAPIGWGNSVEAARLPDGRRIAFTPHHVVILDLHSRTGNLDLEAAMSARLDTWKFSY
jgi:hypothetical protein